MAYFIYCTVYKPLHDVPIMARELGRACVAPVSGITHTPTCALDKEKLHVSSDTVDIYTY